ncbi:unnamed protein product [Brassica oleracea]
MPSRRRLAVYVLTMILKFIRWQMHSVALCGHQFCVVCMRQYIEAMLLEGGVPRCPRYQCESKPILRSFTNLLTLKLRKMWEQRIQEDSIPVADRVYCPNRMCSALMSVSELSKSTNGHMRCCFKCSNFTFSAKFHGLITCPAVITRGWVQILQQMT